MICVIFKVYMHLSVAIAVHIRLQKIRYCYRWIHVDLVTQRVHNKTNLKHCMKKVHS